MNNYLMTVILSLVIAFLSYGQLQKEKVVIVFDQSKMSIDGDRFVIDGQIFKYFSKKKKCQVNYSDIKENVSTLNSMNQKIRKSGLYNNKKKEEFYYSDFFDIYIFKAESETSGLLYPVDRIWVVDAKIVN